jgi:hypothetical protein
MRRDDNRPGTLTAAYAHLTAYGRCKEITAARFSPAVVSADVKLLTTERLIFYWDVF